MNKMRYFDYAATTPLDPEVLKVMLPYFQKEFGNPSNLYKLSRNSKSAIDKATQTITNILGCRTDEFIFTGSATEADNLAILGVARNYKTRKIITSQIEHKAVLNTCEVLEKQGFEIIRLPILKNGLVDLEVLKKELDENTVLVSITMADSETGTIQPIKEISKIIKDFRESRIMNHESGRKKSISKPHNSYFIIHNSFPFFHTDASQAAQYLEIDVNKLEVDLMTLSAHKLYGPKGIGGLFVRKGIKLSPVIFGGGQQSGLRSGTENVPSIVGFAKALELATKNKTASSAVRRRGGNEIARIKRLRDTLEKNIFKSIPKVVLNGHPTKRLPNFLNISLLDVEGEAMLLYLDELGISVSTGSACNSQSLEPSYILSALGRPYEYIHGSLRFTLGKYSTTEDVRYVLKCLPEIVKKLRAISPLNIQTNEKTK